MSWAFPRPGTLQGNWLGTFWMYLWCDSWVFPRYIVHVLTMYLQCPGSGNWGLPPVSGMLLYNWVKWQVSNLSGAHTWKHNMCIDSCIAFTGPFAALENCPRCGKPCYNLEILKKSNGKKKVYQKQCMTFPLGPQYQARSKDPCMAEKMFYQQDKTWELLTGGRPLFTQWVNQEFFEIFSTIYSA